MDANGVEFKSHFMHSSCVIGDRIFIIRTLVRGDSSCVQILDTAQWRWHEVRHAVWPSKFRLSYSCSAVDEKIYVFGGMSEACVPYNDIDVFDTVTCRWTALDVAGRLPPPRHSHTVRPPAARPDFLACCTLCSWHPLALPRLAFCSI